MARNSAWPAKTDDADEEGRVLLVGPSVEVLREWLERADIKREPIFRAIDEWKPWRKGAHAAVDQANRQPRCVMAGLEPEAFSA
jgi:hypothetical protein